MTIYSDKNMLRIAKRFNNAKRQYLLVNPLQAKHIPAKPEEALGMLDALGEQLAAKYPGCRLVIGFAETATAIGAVAAGHLGEACVYLTTTRERVAAGAWLEFLEEHSHAAEQRLCADGLAGWLAATDSVIFVDDEISTGKTLLNMIEQLRGQYPELAAKRLVAASLLNRLSAAAEERLAAAGVECQWLLHLPELDAEAAVAGLEVREAAEVAEAAELQFAHKPLSCGLLPDPRLGLRIGDYQKACEQLARVFCREWTAELAAGSRIVVLGTEECMYPALALGRELEGLGFAVCCHATTRSPIGVCQAPGYPIRSGVKLASFYETGRSTYIYDLEPCEALIVVSDRGGGDLQALRQLAQAWQTVGYQRLFFIDGGKQGEPYVWYL